MVNKQYRALLLAKSSARLWKAARDRFDLPDSTVGGFTEWQYAQLAFGKECQVRPVSPDGHPRGSELTLLTIARRSAASARSPSPTSASARGSARRVARPRTFYFADRLHGSDLGPQS